MPSIRRRIPAVVIACLFAAFPSLARGQSDTTKEYQAQAEDLRNFPQFVTWPAEAQRTPRSTFNFCVLGRDPFGAQLDDAVLGRQFNGRSAQVMRGKRLEDMGACDILFISPSEPNQLSKILRQLRHASVLTVSDAQGFAQSGGVIEFEQQGNAMHFKINVDAAARAGLKISAELLALAEIVHDAPTGHGE